MSGFKVTAVTHLGMEKGGRVYRWMVSWPLLHLPAGSGQVFFFPLMLQKDEREDRDGALLPGKKQGHIYKRTKLNPLSVTGSTNDASVPYVDTYLSAQHLQPHEHSSTGCIACCTLYCHSASEHFTDCESIKCLDWMSTRTWVLLKSLKKHYSM